MEYNEFNRYGSRGEEFWRKNEWFFIVSSFLQWPLYTHPARYVNEPVWHTAQRSAQTWLCTAPWRVILTIGSRITAVRGCGFTQPLTHVTRNDPRPSPSSLLGSTLSLSLSLSVNCYNGWNANNQLESFVLLHTFSINSTWHYSFPVLSLSVSSSSSRENPLRL